MFFILPQTGKQDWWHSAATCVVVSCVVMTSALPAGPQGHPVEGQGFLLHSWLLWAQGIQPLSRGYSLDALYLELVDLCPGNLQSFLNQLFSL